jgi:hypothetical protein
MADRERRYAGVIAVVQQQGAKQIERPTRDVRPERGR